MSGGNDDFQVRIDMKRPVIGIGASIGFFLPQTAKALGARAIFSATDTYVKDILVKVRDMGLAAGI